MRTLIHLGSKFYLDIEASYVIPIFSQKTENFPVSIWIPGILQPASPVPGDYPDNGGNGREITP